jgi:hypothetical protein
MCKGSYFWRSVEVIQKCFSDQAREELRVTCSPPQLPLGLPMFMVIAALVWGKLSQQHP